MGLFGGSLGSLFVKLGADTSGFRKNLKTAEGDLRKTTNRMNAFASTMKVAIPGAALAAGTAYVALIKKTAAWGDKLAKTAKQLGVTTEFLSEMEFAADRSGASLADLNNGIRRLSKAAADANDGMATYKRAFDRLGISVVDTNGRLKSTESLFMEVAEAMSKLENSTLKVATAQDLLGRGGAKLIPLLDQGAAGIKKLRERAEQLGTSLDQETAQNLEDFADALNDLNYAFKGLGVKSTPVLKDLTAALNFLTTPPDNGWKEIFTKIGTAFTKYAGLMQGSPMLMQVYKKMSEARRQYIEDMRRNPLRDDLGGAEDIESYLARDWGKQNQIETLRELAGVYGELNDGTIKLIESNRQFDDSLRLSYGTVTDFKKELTIFTDEGIENFMRLSNRARYFADNSTNAFMDFYDNLRAGESVLESFGVVFRRMAEQIIADMLRMQMYRGFMSLFGLGSALTGGVGGIIGGGNAIRQGANRRRSP